ncbi:hypothetical protein L1887_31655 [Cichorium endivia]|nr:hypothetical protein L1887_31655 [Cichorium endivia]
MDKVNALGERLKIGGSRVSQKISAGTSSMSFKMKEFFQGSNQVDNLVEEATAESLDEPDWATNIELFKNCENTFSEVTAERVLNEMVNMIDDPQTIVNNRNKALILIEAWGVSTEELRYLPVYEEIYKEYDSRVVIPGAWLLYSHALARKKDVVRAVSRAKKKAGR